MAPLSMAIEMVDANELNQCRARAARAAGAERPHPWRSARAPRTRACLCDLRTCG